MRTRTLLLLVVAGLLVWLVPNSQAQSANRPSRFAKVPSTGKITSAIPLGAKREMTVVLKMADDPVAVVRSRMPDKQISEDARKAIAQQLRSKQDALAPMIEAQGGKVMAKFQHAINGIKVRATAEQIASLARLPGVVGVKRVMTHHLSNFESVPFLGTPAVWQGPPGFRGEHIKIAILDTGVDYTHANFGGPGTPAAFAAAFATSTLPADPALFGPNAPKVKGGTDLVGDAYNADDPTSIPMPDPNPLDCAAHGSHVSGTAAGFGVKADGTTFHGPYDSTTPSNKFTIGPGVAPLADLYMVRVFGCSGSTNVVVEGIDWAIANNMQVISMSLGSDFGDEESADAEASENAVEAGIVVVAAAGNAGPVPYITGSPASGDKAISAAAMDTSSPKDFPGANAALSTGGNIVLQDSNAAAFADGSSFPVYVLPDGTGGISRGCNESEYVDALIKGKLVVTMRGTCNRVDRAIFGAKHGAGAVALITLSSAFNNGAGYPPFEGPIPGVGIPFLGVLPGDGPLLAAAASVTLTNTLIPDPDFHTFAGFSSGGPRLNDGHLKPDATAPGVSIISTDMGTGNGGVAFSGTSMATPHIAGVAALTIQAHPKWSADEVRTAVVNTADSTKVNGYSPRKGGAGVVQPFPATRTSVTARSESDEPSLSFGVEEFTHEFKESGEIIVHNHSSHPASFAVTANATADSSPHSVTVHPSFLSLGPHESEELHVKVEVPAATSGDTSDFRQVAGLVSLTPASSSDNGGATLTVPYYVVVRARSEVEAELDGEFGPANPTANVDVNNESHSVPGSADFYAWGLSGTDMKQGSTDLRAVGVQSFDAGPFGQQLVFAMNTFRPWSSASTKEFDILLDVNGDGKPDFQVIGFDLGAVLTGSVSGQMASFVLDLNNPANGLLPEFLALGPTDEGTILLGVNASDVGITATNPRFTYTADIVDFLSPAVSHSTGLGKFNAFKNALSTGDFRLLSPGGQASVPLTIDPVEWTITPANGVMIVSTENVSRHKQALLLPVPSGGNSGEGDKHHD